MNPFTAKYYLHVLSRLPFRFLPTRNGESPFLVVARLVEGDPVRAVSSWETATSDESYSLYPKRGRLAAYAALLESFYGRLLKIYFSRLLLRLI
jgi:hypothetical protein